MMRSEVKGFYGNVHAEIKQKKTFQVLSQRIHHLEHS
jgi:hypothetical protein